MSKEYFEKIDKEEETRVNEVYNQGFNQDEVKKHVFHSKKIYDVLNSSQLRTVVNSSSLIPCVLPFYNNVFSTICLGCTAKKEDKERKKLLIKKGLIIPILFAPYSDFPEDFADLVYSVPHINSHELECLIWANNTQSNNVYTCPHCVSKKYPWLGEKITQASPLTKFYWDSFLGYFSSFAGPQGEKLFEKMAVGFKNNNQTDIEKAYQQSNVIWKTSISKALKSSLQVRMKEIEEMVPLYTSSKKEIVDTEELVFNSLFSVYYSENINYEDQLNLFIKKRSTIANVCKAICNGQSSETDYRKIQEKLEDINTQILDMEKSKRYRLYQMFTKIVNMPASFVSSLCLSGSNMSLAANCSAANISELMKSDKNEGLADDLYQEILAKVLGKDKVVIQAWDCRKAIEKSSSQ